MWEPYPVAVSLQELKFEGFIKSDTRPVITTNYLVIVSVPFKVKVSGDNSLFLITYFRENHFVFTCYFLISWPPNKSLVPVGLPCEPTPREQLLDAINHWQRVIYSVSHSCRVHVDTPTRCWPLPSSPKMLPLIWGPQHLPIARRSRMLGFIRMNKCTLLCHRPNHSTHLIKSWKTDWFCGPWSEEMTLKYQEHLHDRVSSLPA